MAQSAVLTPEKPAVLTVAPRPEPMRRPEPVPAPPAPPVVEEPQLNPAEFAMWLHQLSLLLCACSGMFALAAARFADRPWLPAVFSAFVAAFITGFAGTAVAKALQHLCVAKHER